MGKYIIEAELFHCQKESKMDEIYCQCGKPADPCFGSKCENCWADIQGHRGPYIFKSQPKSAADFLLEPINELGLRARSVAVLESHGIRTIGDLVKKSEAELLAIHGFGKKTIQDIKDELSGWDLELRKE